MPIVGVGVDLVDVDRLASALARTPGLAERLFSSGERADVGEDTSRLAARFAAKEAVSKALGLRGARFAEVEVVRTDTGRPTVRLSGECAEVAAASGVTSWHLSLAHDGGVATAFVVAEA